ncbi:hypothetical protein HYPSUDRAFT_204661 [Hypholoma sublateritium FD-334 SS-4]|uniref:Uncharacterized protein n=1 Tax=Hypholoma sublateritium (strain FD-334 SS-4) TaxID=945553 RepID=A0A0D2PGP0_HYPSF|nr:hypothetical protein HYPSUDRAFT_204661 [Hypholoma sublateritium FD-334 SS-4]
MSAEHSNPQNLPYQDDGPDGFYYSTVGQEKDLALLPDFFLPALEHSLAMKQVKKLPAVANASATPVLVQPRNHVVLGDVKLKVPANPPPTDFELMKIHHQAMSLMERLGISYKEACNRIYNMSHQRVIAADLRAKEWGDLEKMITDELYYLKGVRDAIRKEDGSK